MTATALRVGTSVRARGRQWRVDAIERGDDCTAVRLSALGRSHDRTLTLLTPFDRVTPIDRPRSLRIVRPRRCLDAIYRVMADALPFGGLSRIAPTTIRIVPYQLEPALAVLRYGATRVLIADDVGLGKTIQAGIVLLELSGQSDSFRALVLTPAGLREQWREELRRHFDLDASLADADWLRRIRSDLPADVNPWSLPGIYIASHDFIKRPEALRPLEDVTWDIVIADEAHHAAPGTDRRAAVDAAASRALRVVLLTATPDAGDQDGFLSLCNIGRAGERDPRPAFFAREKNDVHAGLVRRTRLHFVAPTATETALHRELERYSERVWREASARGDERARLVSIVLRKRGLSSASALLVSVLRRLEFLRGQPDPEALQLPLPLDDEDPLDDREPFEALASPGLADVERERRWLAAIAEMSRAASRDESKLRWLMRFVRRVREPVIVFTEYRDTLSRLQQRLASVAPIAVLHGGMHPRERSDVAARLNVRGETLVATDAAAEGLNLHHHCRIVVHYELPWSPARLEQRAGRVDRIGQTRRVHEVALVSSSRSEQLVLKPLAIRASRAVRRTALLRPLTESQVAHAVMSDRPSLIDRDLPGNRRWHRGAAVLSLNLRREADDEASRLERAREILRRLAARTAGGARPAACLVRSASVSQGDLHLVYALRLSDNEGRTVHTEHAVACLEDVRAVAVISHQDLRQFFDRHTRGNASLDEWLRERLSDLHVRILPAVELARALVQARRQAISGVQASGARRIVQLRFLAPQRERSRELVHVAIGDVNCELSADANLDAAVLWLGRGRG